MSILLESFFWVVLVMEYCPKLLHFIGGFFIYISLLCRISNELLRDIDVTALYFTCSEYPSSWLLLLVVFICVHWCRFLSFVLVVNLLLVLLWTLGEIRLEVMIYFYVFTFCYVIIYVFFEFSLMFCIVFPFFFITYFWSLL